MALVLKFNCELAYRITCSVCGVKILSKWKIHHGEEPPHPSLPDGWRVLDGDPICGEHEISVSVKPVYKTVWVSELESLVTDPVVRAITEKGHEG